ncbi:MAG: hypothetical protein K2Z81_11560 [Cyanobacteria bacterium]|nr:hypothetical protein [Cyanobacteriota bacterium]
MFSKSKVLVECERLICWDVVRFGKGSIVFTPFDRWRSSRNVLSSGLHALVARLSLALFLLCSSSTPGKVLNFECGSCAAKTEAVCTVSDVINDCGQIARKRLVPEFEKNGVEYPPEKITLIGLKDEEVLLVFARDRQGTQKQIKLYPIVDASGNAGPKLKQGDKQVPEGVYKISGLHPNSIAYLALRVNYPNDEDKANAKKDKRTNIGGNIEIHGSFWSTGCLAMGNTAIEDLFVLANDVGCDNIQLILCPCDLRTKVPAIDVARQPAWVAPLYDRLKRELTRYPIDVELYPSGSFDLFSNLEQTISF